MRLPRALLPLFCAALLLATQGAQGVKLPTPPRLLQATGARAVHAPPSAHLAHAPPPLRAPAALPRSSPASSSAPTPSTEEPVDVVALPVAADAAAAAAAAMAAMAPAPEPEVPAPEAELRAVAAAPDYASITDFLLAAQPLQTLLAAVEAAGLTETLSDPTLAVTLFAPTRRAFAAAAAAMGVTPAELLADKDALSTVLLLHIIPGVYSTADLAAAAAQAQARARGARERGGRAMVPLHLAQHL